MTKAVVTFLVGLLSGVVISVGVWVYSNLHRADYTSRQPVVISFGAKSNVPVTVPMGTTFKFDSHFSEGFDQLCLYVNVEHSDRDAFDITSSDVISPYWISKPEHGNAP